MYNFQFSATLLRLGTKTRQCQTYLISTAVNVFNSLRTVACKTAD